MPKFQVTSPDGKSFEVSAPDGASQEQVLAYAQSQFANQAPTQGAAAEPIPKNMDVASNAGNKAIAALPDAVLNAPTNLYNLAKSGIVLGGRALGYDTHLPYTEPPDYARKGMEKLGLIDPAYEPKTAGQRMLAAGAGGGVSMAMNPASSGKQLAMLLGTGVASGLAGQGTKEATGSDAAAMLASMATPLAINATANAARSKISDLAAERSRNAPKDNALAAALDEGYQVPPSSVNRSLPNRTLETVAGKVAVQQETSLNNAEKTNALARRAIGLPDDAPLTPEATQAIRREAYQTGYAPLAGAGQVTTGRLYRQDLDNIVAQYQGAARSFPAAVRDDVSNMVNSLRRRSFDAGDAVKMSATLREDASQSFSTGNAALGKAQRAAADAIENQIERGLGSTPQTAEMMQNFRDARKLMAKAHTVEDAIQVGTGSVDARKLAAALQGGSPLEGDLRTVAEFAKNYPKAVQPPSMVGSPVNNLRAYASMAGGGAGAALGQMLGHPTMGAMAGAAIPAIASPAAKSLLLSKTYQGMQVPSYNASMMARLLAGTPELSYQPLMQQLNMAQQLKGQ